MPLLSPNWKQEKPTANDVRNMCVNIRMELVQSQDKVISGFVRKLQESHAKGGAYLGAFSVGTDSVFDWFGSRNRLTDYALLDSLLLHSAVRDAFPEVFKDLPREVKTGLEFYDPFLLDGTFARLLYNGGAYSQSSGDGRAQKAFALRMCKAMFGLRYSEISCYLSGEAWARWFKGVAWDVSLIIFDRRNRVLWILLVTDTD